MAVVEGKISIRQFQCTIDECGITDGQVGIVLKDDFKRRAVTGFEGNTIAKRQRAFDYDATIAASSDDGSSVTHNESSGVFNYQIGIEQIELCKIFHPKRLCIH